MKECAFFVIIFPAAQYQRRPVFSDFSPFCRFEIEPYHVPALRDILRRRHLISKFGEREFCQFIGVGFFRSHVGQ